MHLALHSLDSLSNATWIIDAGVSNQMYVNFNLLANPKTHNSSSPIHLPDGSSQLIKHRGNVVLNTLY